MASAGMKAAPAPPWLRVRTVEIALRPQWRSWVAFLVVAVGALVLGGAALRTAIIDLLGESDDAEKIHRAITMDPANPELYHRLGMVLCTSSGEACRTEGWGDLRRATELDPRTARYWTDLAWVCEMAGDTACAAESVEQAVKVSPMTPQVHWLAANTLLREGQREGAMAEFRRLLELDPTYAPATFHVCLGSLGDPQLILQKVIPPAKDPSLRLAYLTFLRTNEEDEFAPQVWRQIVETGTRFPFSVAAPYIEHLLERGSFDEAQGAWRDLEKLGIIPSPPPGDDGNLVYNGDFESTPLNTGFDWRDQPAPFIALDFSDPSSHKGNRCLRIDFTVSRNEQYAPITQLIPVSPKQSYVLTAFVRSQDITSDSGPRLQMLDPVQQRDPNMMSETTVGTTPWHQISLKFCTGAATKIVQLSVVRVRGRSFPTEISGSFWLDTVALKPLADGESVCAEPAP
jgi:hypothetical protein